MSQKQHLLNKILDYCKKIETNHELDNSMTVRITAACYCDPGSSNLLP